MHIHSTIHLEMWCDFKRDNYPKQVYQTYRAPMKIKKRKVHKNWQNQTLLHVNQQNKWKTTAIKKKFFFFKWSPLEVNSSAIDLKSSAVDIMSSVVDINFLYITYPARPGLYINYLSLTIEDVRNIFFL